MDEKVVYEEAGRVHRHFLGWRHAAVVGYFAALYAIASLATQLWDNHPTAVVWLLLLSSPVGVILAVIDNRTRRLYHAAQEAAKAIEAGTAGKLYERLTAPPDRHRGDDKPGPHTRALRALYWGYSFTLIAVAAVLWGRL